MSQYPSPYQPPDPYSNYMYAWGHYQALLGPFQRASVLMFILAGVGVLCGTCMGVAGAMLPLDQMPPEVQAQLAELEGMGVSLRAVFVAMAVLMALPSVLLAVLGIFVRKASRVAVYLSIALVAVIVGLLALNVASGVMQGMGAGAGAAQMVPAMCVNAAILGLFVLLLAWLIQAARAVRGLDWAGRQYQEQYWQYMQNQRQYGAGGMGAAPGPPPGAGPVEPPQVPPPPPPPPPREDRGPGERM